MENISSIKKLLGKNIQVFYNLIIVRYNSNSLESTIVDKQVFSGIIDIKQYVDKKFPVGEFKTEKQDTIYRIKRVDNNPRYKNIVYYYSIKLIIEKFL